MLNALLNYLSENIDSPILRNEPMSAHTSFKVGGPADGYVSPTMMELVELIYHCKENEIPYMIIGNGSNLLVKDGGIKGLVISIGKQMSDISVDGETITAGAGASLSALAMAAKKASLTGLEWAAGIPGSVGGAVYMNAGAYGGEIALCIKSAQVLTADGEIEIWDKERLDLSYRHSAIMGTKNLILEATFELQSGDEKFIELVMNKNKEARLSKQPLEYPSAGSTFKRPDGNFAGKLIEEAGLKGYTVGGAQVSEKHCGFVINKNNATATDIITLINDVSDKVFENSGVRLEPEVIIVGRD